VPILALSKSNRWGLRQGLRVFMLFLRVFLQKHTGFGEKW
jgi:hypothetical protein